MPRALTALLALVLTAALAAPAAADPKKNPRSPEETAAYWTAERMKNAKPRERARGGAGGGGKVSDWWHGAVPTVDGAYTGEDAKNGKVFMTIGGVDYVCSGTAVDADPGVNLVWTAGHCVTDGRGKEATNLLFAPGYNRGVGPAGAWAYTWLDSTETWEDQGGDRFNGDVGAFQVVKSGATSATFAGTGGIGTRDMAFGVVPETRRIISHGYPAAGKFSGATQFACASPFRRWDRYGATAMQISCDMTGGSSGGGWFLDESSPANNTADPGEPLISVNSYGYTGEKNTMYGPYLGVGSEAQALYNAMSTTSPTGTPALTTG